MAAYCLTWRLKISPSKTASSVFHVSITSAAGRPTAPTWPQSSLPGDHPGQNAELPGTPEKGCMENSELQQPTDETGSIQLGRGCQYSGSINTGFVLIDCSPVWQGFAHTNLSMHNYTMTCASSLALFVHPFLGCRFSLTFNLQLYNVWQRQTGCCIR